MKSWEETIYSLKELLALREDIEQALELSIQKAAIPEVQTLDDYGNFLRKLLTEIPRQRDMSPLANQFHYLISQSPGDILKKDEGFRKWLRTFSQSHGSFLDTTASAENLQTFFDDPSYHIEDYDPGASGWLTFNQFFARHTRPGKRPIAEWCNDSVVVSAADSVFKGSWPIDTNASVTAKGTKYAITELLKDSPYADAFAGGVFTHSYLDANDYHRFHVPAAGTVREARKIPGDVLVTTIKKEDGELETLDEVGFQFTQTRGLLILDSPVGLIAVLPIGMGHVSSVNITAASGAQLYKGEEFGYFSYGGSDMVMLFQAGKVRFTAETGKHYQQGEAIAIAGVTATSH